MHTVNGAHRALDEWSGERVARRKQARKILTTIEVAVRPAEVTTYTGCWVAARPLTGVTE